MILSIPKKINILLLGMLCFFNFGCGAINHHLDSIDSWASIIDEKQIEYSNSYLGRPKEILLDVFGKPSIKSNVGFRGLKYDESWAYRTSGTWLQTNPGGSVWFYINDGIIQDVSVW